MNERTGILLIGHGTRNDQGSDEFLTLARLLQRQWDPLPVVPAFLELRGPTIADAISQLVSQGVNQIVATPLLLFAAGHAQRDIPDQVHAALRERPEMVRVQTAALECESHLVQLSRLRFETALRSGTNSSETLLILVGRGSSDAGAIAKMRDFAELRSQESAVGAARVGFIAMAEPRIGSVLSQAAEEAWATIVVQPHLLFQGELLEELEQRVSEMAIQHPRQVWRMAPHLAAGIGSGDAGESLLLAAISQRIAEALKEPVQLPAAS